MVDMVNELDGKVAIVTGSARNIGRATAEELAKAGAAMVINSVQAKDLCEEVVEGIRAAGGKAIPFMADVRDANAVNAMAAAAEKEFGGIDIMVHNAAVRNNTTFEDMTLETFSTTVDISVYGMFNLAKAVLPSMKTRGGGSIIGVGGMSSTPRLAHALSHHGGKNGPEWVRERVGPGPRPIRHPRQSSGGRHLRHGPRRQSVIGTPRRT